MNKSTSEDEADEGIQVQNDASGGLNMSSLTIGAESATSSTDEKSGTAIFTEIMADSMAITFNIDNPGLQLSDVGSMNIPSEQELVTLPLICVRLGMDILEVAAMYGSWHAMRCENERMPMITFGEHTMDAYASEPNVPMYVTPLGDSCFRFRYAAKTLPGVQIEFVDGKARQRSFGIIHEDTMKKNHACSNTKYAYFTTTLSTRDGITVMRAFPILYPQHVRVPITCKECLEAA